MYDAQHHRFEGTITFAPPYSEEELPMKHRRHNQYASSYLHGLRWDHGNAPYRRLEALIRRLTWGFSRLYVKGLEKKNPPAAHHPPCDDQKH